MVKIKLPEGVNDIRFEVWAENEPQDVTLRFSARDGVIRSSYYEGESFPPGWDVAGRIRRAIEAEFGVSEDGD